MPAMTSNVLTFGGRAEHDHVVAVPFWVFIVRIFQLVLAIIIVGLTGFADSVFKYAYSGFGMTWFTFAWTILFFIYLGVSYLVMPQVYNIWIHLGVEAATTLWWLISFALLASEAAAWGIIDEFDIYGDVVQSYLPSNYNSAIKCAKASAGLGALEWILFIVTLIRFGLTAHHHRLSHLPTTTGPAAPATMTEEHKMQPITSAQPVVAQDPRYPQQQQQQYPQQPQQQQQQQYQPYRQPTA